MTKGGGTYTSIFPQKKIKKKLFTFSLNFSKNRIFF